MSSEAFKAITLDRILARRNLWEAMKKVQANKGSPGVDGMKTEELKEYFFENPGKTDSDDPTRRIPSLTY